MGKGKELGMGEGDRVGGGVKVGVLRVEKGGVKEKEKGGRDRVRGGVKGEGLRVRKRGKG